MTAKTTNAVPDPALEVPPVELRPSVEHLVTEADTPVDNTFSEKQRRLLTEPLYSSWAGLGGGRSFVAMANVGLFYAVRQPAFVPDVMLTLDVELPADLWPKAHRSYFVWEYGKGLTWSSKSSRIAKVARRQAGWRATRVWGCATT